MGHSFFLPDRPTHPHEREGDGKRNNLLGWPYANCPWTWPEQRSNNSWHTQEPNSRLLLPLSSLLLHVPSSPSVQHSFNLTSPVYSSSLVYSGLPPQHFSHFRQFLRPAILHSRSRQKALCREFRDGFIDGFSVMKMCYWTCSSITMTFFFRIKKNPGNNTYQPKTLNMQTQGVTTKERGKHWIEIDYKGI